MPRSKTVDGTSDECLKHFASLVNSTGIKHFAQSVDLSTRQVNRVLSGSQPNPIERTIRCILAAPPEVGDMVIDFICQELGGHFVREEVLNDATVNAVKECAEAIAAISDGHVHDRDVKEIRDAISALSSLIMSLRQASRKV